MKFRTMLLASAAVMFTSSAFAADITNPFFLPTQGKFLSDTSVEYSRAKMDLGAQLGEDVGKDIYANETLTFGLTDNLAIVGSIGNTFDYNDDDNLNNDHNFDYMLGVKYNHNFGKVLTQVGVSYWTMDPRSWYGTSGEGAMYKLAMTWAASLRTPTSLLTAILTKQTESRTIHGSSVLIRCLTKLLLTEASVTHLATKIWVMAKVMLMRRLGLLKLLPTTM